MKVKNNIILALDVMNMKEATEICEKLEKENRLSPHIS